MIYFDYNSTTPVRKEVLETMWPFFTECYANAASSHTMGMIANHAVENSREQIANYLNSTSEEIYFTSGATEGLNILIKGLSVKHYNDPDFFIFTSPTEHAAVIDVLNGNSKFYNKVKWVSVDNCGIPNLDELDEASYGKRGLFIFMAVNNETGVINPLMKISEIAQKNNFLLLSDLSQAIGKIKVDINDLGIDAGVLSAHKFYGPKGVGAIFMKRKSAKRFFSPVVFGGGQEDGFRPGTHNVSGIAGMGKAIDLINEEYWELTNKVLNLRDYFETKAENEFSAKINCKVAKRVFNTSNVRFDELTAEQMIKKFSGFCFSKGSACSSQKNDLSHVLSAINLGDENIRKSLRFSFGIYNTTQEIDSFFDKLKTIIDNK